MDHSNNCLKFLGGGGRGHEVFLLFKTQNYFGGTMLCYNRAKFILKDSFGFTSKQISHKQKLILKVKCHTGAEKGKKFTYYLNGH